MARIIKATGELEKIEPGNHSDFQLEELQKIVGGYIEIINLFNGKILVVNEEGKLKGLEQNEIATTIAHDADAIADWDCIVGDVLYCLSEEVQ